MALVNNELAKVLAEAEPVTYWKPLAFARPIEVILAPEPVFSVPLDDDNVSYKLIFLNASTEPETNPTSGAPNIFVTLT